MDDRNIRRRIQRQTRELLQQLDVQPPLDMAKLVELIAEHRGRPIELRAHPIPADGPFGACIPDHAEDKDWIFYQKSTSRAHQAHIIAHELGHLLCGHISRQDLPAERAVITEADARERYPDIDPRIVAYALHRECYDELREAEAETVASVLGEWASVLNAAAGAPSAGDARHLDSALTDSIGWWR